MNSDRVCREWHEHSCSKCSSIYKVSGTIDDCKAGPAVPNWLCENCLKGDEEVVHEHHCNHCGFAYDVPGLVPECNVDKENDVCPNCRAEARPVNQFNQSASDTADDVLSHKHVCNECQAVYETPGTCSLVHPRVCSPCAEHEHQFEYKVGIDPIGRTEYVHVACTVGDCRVSFRPETLDFSGELPDRLRS